MKDAMENSDESDLDVMVHNVVDAEKMLKSLANANRLMILCYLLEGEKTVSQLSDLIELSQSSISQHLAKMRNNGMVECEKRGHMAYYHIRSKEVGAILSVLHLIYCKR